MKRLFTALSSDALDFILLALLMALPIVLTGCGKVADEKRMDKSPVNVVTSCYNGVEYFTVWNGNTADANYLAGAVIDEATLQPKRCGSPKPPVPDR